MDFVLMGDTLVSERGEEVEGGGPGTREGILKGQGQRSIGGRYSRSLSNEQHRRANHKKWETRPDKNSGKHFQTSLRCGTTVYWESGQTAKAAEIDYG